MLGSRGSLPGRAGGILGRGLSRLGSLGCSLGGRVRRAGGGISGWRVIRFRGIGAKGFL